MNEHDGRRVIPIRHELIPIKEIKNTNDYYGRTTNRVWTNKSDD